MKVTWAYDRGDHRDNHEADLTDPAALEALLHEIHEAAEPVAITIFSDTTDDPDELPPGLQIGLGHPTHAFAVHIADDGGYLTDPTVQSPSGGLSFDLGGVPTEYPAEHLRIRPETAIQIAATYLKTGGEAPHVPTVAE
ncbi:Imm1 family immunity protein [Micromonospora olivasterospora]|uniref:Immunity protein Imm1 of predicted polymorphic toxin system n=1 Tax=Micromonospora olivasterospora TaxID=1880 RepID=A0A562I8D8_MICOL|nr:Imm1 family immunity protein [Micromonospora olivasterospora]TWH67259.1 immunity protein Imm1 of predicted polymorphic toxin system [Micromonospora olivasterospora]